jgi:hypothetical protein
MENQTIIFLKIFKLFTVGVISFRTKLYVENIALTLRGIEQFVRLKPL